MGRYRPPTPTGSKYITPEGSQRLQDELDYLWKTKRPAVTQSVREAAAQGDRSENAEYIYRKKQLGEIDRRIRYLRKRLEAIRIIDTTPAWKPIVAAMAALAPGGRLVINAIRKEDGDKGELQRLDYPAHLWMEKEIKSVANVSRRDVREFLSLGADMGIKPEFQEFALEEANQALVELKSRKIRGAKVLRIE